MDGFDVTTGRIATAAAGVEQVADALTGEIATMRDLLGEISAGWQSSAAAPRFLAAMQGYLDQAAALKDALASHGQGLTATVRAFERAEDAIAQSTPAVTG
ncbi:MAG TPA: WXG100 family type VII secretion target [Nakamurella sp.]|jgi:WXG100 family type VII secretion target|nr:WXG100 family type VII secretion target [Nakamurella sp.]